MLHCMVIGEIDPAFAYGAKPVEHCFWCITLFWVLACAFLEFSVLVRHLSDLCSLRGGGGRHRQRTDRQFENNKHSHVNPFPNYTF